jgi:UDP-N-acetylmuramoylalanine--D-glutamate ligase
MIRVTTFAGQRVAVFGLGGSGLATARALIAGGADVAAWDDGDGGRAAAEAAGVTLLDLKTADWSQFKALVLSPGVPLTHPEPHWTVKAAKAAGVEVIGDIELFVRERAAAVPGLGLGCPLIAITGTNGKSTTTALTAHILKTAGFDVQMGGNIGTPVLELEPPLVRETIGDRRFHVLEVSTFQIDLAPSLKPTFGVLLNLTPDHIDRHGTFANYAAIKERMIAASHFAIVGVDDEHCRHIYARQAITRSGNMNDQIPTGISGEKQADPGIGVKGSQVGTTRKGEFRPLVDLAGVGALRGAHNAQNVAAALAATLPMVSMRALAEDAANANANIAALLQQAIATFPGLPHRMEEIGKAGRVLFINDSKATNADSTEKALAAFSRDIYWIVGGKAKEGGITPLEPYFPRVAKAYLIGEAKHDFAAALKGHAEITCCGTLEHAVAAAAKDAALNSGGEPVVLLSPACASYDQFKNFEVRGDTFRSLVAALPGVVLKGGGG